jgi:hypothetical protein
VDKQREELIASIEGKLVLTNSNSPTATTSKSYLQSFGNALDIRIGLKVLGPPSTYAIKVYSTEDILPRQHGHSLRVSRRQRLRFPRSSKDLGLA